MIFLTKLLSVLTGLSKVRSGDYLLRKQGLAFKEQNWDQMNWNVELVGGVEDRLKLDPSILVTAVIVDVLAVQETTFVYVIKHFLG